MKHYIELNHSISPLNFSLSDSIMEIELCPKETLPQEINSAPTLLYILEGSLFVAIAQQSIYLKQDDILLIFRGYPYTLTCSNDNQCTFYKLVCSTYSINKNSTFALLAPDSYVDIMEYFSFGYKKFLQLKPNKEIHRILDNIFWECSFKNIYYKEIYNLHSASLLFLVFRELEFFFAQKDIYVNKHFITAIKYLNANYAQKITLKDIAETCNISGSYLSKLFQSALGIPISQFIIFFRIDKAWEMMMSKNYTLSEIALETGFSSLQHFSKAFKKEMGMSPKAYLLLIDSKNNK